MLTARSPRRLPRRATGDGEVAAAISVSPVLAAWPLEQRGARVARPWSRVCVKENVACAGGSASYYGHHVEDSRPARLLPARAGGDCAASGRTPRTDRSTTRAYAPVQILRR
jgi:hypothetical protein